MAEYDYEPLDEDSPDEDEQPLSVADRELIEQTKALGLSPAQVLAHARANIQRRNQSAAKPHTPPPAEEEDEDEPPLTRSQAEKLWKEQAEVRDRALEQRRIEQEENAFLAGVLADALKGDTWAAQQSTGMQRELKRAAWLEVAKIPGSDDPTAMDRETLQAHIQREMQGVITAEKNRQARALQMPTEDERAEQNNAGKLPGQAPTVGSQAARSQKPGTKNTTVADDDEFDPDDESNYGLGAQWPSEEEARRQFGKNVARYRRDNEDARRRGPGQ